MRKNASVALVDKTYDTYKNDLAKQKRELKRLAREGQRSGDYLLLAAAYCALAESYSQLDEMDGMFSSALKAVALLKDTDQYELLVRAYGSLGYVYTYQENTQMALSIDELAWQLVKKHRLKGQTRIRALNSLSVSYHEAGDCKSSIRFLTECLELINTEDREDVVGRAMYTLNLAECHKDSGELEKAREVLASMAPWIDEVPYSPVVCDYYLRYAINAYQRGDREKGDGFMDRAFGLIPEDSFPHPIYDDLRLASHILSHSGDRERAGRILKLMTVYAEKNKDPMPQLFACRMMADYYHSFGEYERAADYYGRCEELNERRANELKTMHLQLHKRMLDTDAEIRALKRKMRRSEELITREPLTGLLNRSALLTLSAEFIAAAERRKQKVGGIFIDIDFFKECNDTYGHARGDEIIREVARACRREETANIRFARYGGDEFFGITRGLTDAEVTDVACRICRSIREADLPHEKNPNGGRITLSAGVVNVAITEHTDTIIEIANYADKAVYYAKNAGKNAVYLLDYDGSVDKKGRNAAFVNIPF